MGKSTLVGPVRVTLTDVPEFQNTKQPVCLEYSVHLVPRSMVHECLTVLPCINKDTDNLLCVPTFQKADDDLTEFTEKAAYEKDRLLESFFAWGKLICAELNKAGHWADVIDPCSGYPLLTDRGSSIYSEVAGMNVLLKYKLYKVSGCSLIEHPVWKTRCYPASLFTLAPQDLLEKAIANANTSLGAVNAAEPAAEASA